MRWFTRPGRPPEAPPLDHRSPGLRALLDSLHPESRSVVLDLGPPVPGNIELLSALSCRVRVADLQRALVAEPPEAREADAAGALAERLLPLAPGERFDAVLAWDVLDWLRPHEVAALMARLASACAAEAPVLAFAARRRDARAAPTRYRILDRETVARDDRAEAARPGPRYGQGELQRLMPAFVVKHSVLLRSGVQEYLFARAAHEAPRPAGAAAPARAVPAASAWYRRVPV